MYVDAMTLAAVLDEWHRLLIGARIDTIIQPTEHAIALQCYVPAREEQGTQREQRERTERVERNRWLYLSAHPQMARAHITARKPTKIASEPPPFVMLLRKYLEGARIEEFTLPRWERVIEIIAGYHDQESGEHVRFRLIIEIMGRLSNIIFCNEQGLILGSLKRVGADVNRYRVIAAGVPYVPPPPQQRTVAGQPLPRLEPTTITAAQLAICASNDSAQSVEQVATGKGKKRANETPRLWQVLTGHLLGFSPLMAREVVYRTTEDAETPLPQELAGAAEAPLWQELAWHVRDLASLYDSHRWHPQLVERRSDDGTQRFPIAFSVYLLEQYLAQADVEVHDEISVNMLLDDYFERAEWRDALEALRAPIRKVLQTQIERCKRKAELLRQEMALVEEAAQYRLQAELLLAHQYEIQQGQTNVVLHNFFAQQDGEPGEMISVTLDPRFDAVGNANRLFSKYHKLRRAAELVPGQIEQNAAELATVEQLLADLMLAETPQEVALVKAEVQAAGYMKGKLTKQEQKAAKKTKANKGGKLTKGKPTPPGGGVPLHVQSRDGFTLLIGKNSRQNEEVTFHQATGNDIWLHARGVPGAHVIIKAAGREVPHSTIEQAAQLAAYYSQARGSTSVPVDYTLQRYVRHMKGAGPGMVIYEREKTIYAEPNLSTLSTLPR
jgi:predicted ribosome quality control (RQC) complex YloA/Tae2 family protein